MPAPVPARERDELHNRLISLSYEDDLAEIEKIKWRLQTLVRKNPSDIVAAVSLIEALRRSGNHNEAVALINSIWGRHRSLEGAYLSNLTSALMCLGLYGRAKELIGQATSGQAGKGDKAISKNAVIASLASGDLPWLMKLTDDSFVKEGVSNFLRIIEKSGLAEHFLPHQKIINEFVVDHQCGVGVDESYDPGEDDEDSGICTYVFIPKDYSFRRELDRKIWLALEEYYISKGLPPGIYTGRFTTMLTGVPFPEAHVRTSN